MSTRAGIVVTGTEVLSGRVTDRNGPWLSEQLGGMGIELSHITIVGDRPEDMLAALRFMAEEGMDLVITSGGLGPTADDLTIEIVARFAERPMVLDEPLLARIGEILKPLLARWPDLDPDAVMASNRKQALVPEGATILYPVGTAPGLVVPPLDGRVAPTVVVLPGPPRELQPMWRDAVGTEGFRAATAGAGAFEQGMLRLFGIPESEIAETLRAAEREGIAIDTLEITTCLRRGEVEVVTRFDDATAPVYDALHAFIRGRLPDALFSEDGSTVDEQVRALLDGRTIAVAESCTGGLLAARLTDPPGASAYMLGGVVVYSNEAKVALAGVGPDVIARHGAVSAEVAKALARGAVERFGADVGVGVTGIAGPDGGTEEKPVGTVCFSVVERGGGSIARQTTLPGDRPTVRDRSTTVALHLVRRLLLGQHDAAAR